MNGGGRLGDGPVLVERQGGGWWLEACSGLEGRCWSEMGRRFNERSGAALRWAGAGRGSRGGAGRWSRAAGWRACGVNGWAGADQRRSGALMNGAGRLGDGRVQPDQGSGSMDDGPGQEKVRRFNEWSGAARRRTG